MPKMLTALYAIPIIALIAFCVWFLIPEAKAQDVHYVSPMPDVHLDVMRLKSACKAAENSSRSQVSRSGCRSEYQFKESTWRQHSGKPFLMASRHDIEATAEIERVARKHIAWIMNEIAEKRYTVTPAMVGQVWAAGLTAWLEHRLTFHDVEFGQRVANCYEATSK